MNARQLFRKQHPESRQLELKELRQDLHDRGLDEKQIALILERRAKLVRVAYNHNISLRFLDGDVA